MQPRGAVLEGTVPIGVVAARAGVNVQTLRYYERRGLIERPARSAAGYRRYRPETIAAIRGIKRAQRLGFTLSEVRELVGLGQRRSIARVRAIAEAKMRSVDEKLRALRQMRRALRTVLDTCRCGGDVTRCLVLYGRDDEPSAASTPRTRRSQRRRK